MAKKTPRPSRDRSVRAPEKNPQRNRSVSLQRRSTATNRDEPTRTRTSARTDSGDLPPTAGAARATRAGRAGRGAEGGRSAAERDNQSGRFGGSAASRSRGEEQHREGFGASRRDFASMDTDRPRGTSARRGSNRAPAVNPRHVRPVAPPPGERDAENSAALERPQPVGRAGLRGQGGWQSKEDGARPVPRDESNGGDDFDDDSLRRRRPRATADADDFDSPAGGRGNRDDHPRGVAGRGRRGFGGTRDDFSETPATGRGHSREEE